MSRTSIPNSQLIKQIQYFWGWRGVHSQNCWKTRGGTSVWATTLIQRGVCGTRKCRSCEQPGVLGRVGGGIPACPWQRGVRAEAPGMEWRGTFVPQVARYLAQAILDNSEWVREGCIAGKSAEGRARMCLGSVQTRGRRNTSNTAMHPTGSGQGGRAGVRAR